MATIKLTKKQQKAAAFRGKKGRGREDPQDVPIMDDLVADDGFGLTVVEPLKAKAVMPEELPSKSSSKKRKRDEDATAINDLPNKRIKGHAKVGNTESAKPKEKKPAAGPKYILFVGNLSYKTTTESIAEHFAACDPPPTIRRLTSRKGPSTTPDRPEKSKGCAFLEFTKASGLQNALRLHHSELDGRQINVELSAGGGGKSETRLKKLKEKNAKLDKHRVEASSHEDGPDGDDILPGPPNIAKPRHSSTSGTKLAPQRKPATWSVARQGEAAGRGGQKHRKPSRTDEKRQNGRSNAWEMSGANAIPVG